MFPLYISFEIFCNFISFCLFFSGSGAAMDIVVSSVRAYLSALNKMLSFVTVVNATRESPEGSKTYQNIEQNSE